MVCVQCCLAWLEASSMKMATDASPGQTSSLTPKRGAPKRFSYASQPLEYTHREAQACFLWLWWACLGLLFFCLDPVRARESIALLCSSNAIVCFEQPPPRHTTPFFLPPRPRTYAAGRHPAQGLDTRMLNTLDTGVSGTTQNALRRKTPVTCLGKQAPPSPHRSQ